VNHTGKIEWSRSCMEAPGRQRVGTDLEKVSGSMACTQRCGAVCVCVRILTRIVGAGVGGTNLGRDVPFGLSPPVLL
jgi:hypothetical protein